MGLDISLYRCKNLRAVERDDALGEEISERIWNDYPKYDEMTQEQKDEASRRTKEEYEKNGLDEWGSSTKIKRIDNKPSKKYPDHLFRIDYWRSSYNASGFNSVLGNAIGMDLWDLIQHDENKYYQKVDWENALETAEEMLKEWKKYTAETPLKCFSTGVDITRAENLVMSEEEAIKKVQKEMLEHTNLRSFSNNTGEYFLDGLDVVGLVVGKGKYSFDSGRKVYVVYKMDQGTIEHYTQSIEIVIETCKYVLAKKNPDEYVLSWSY